MVAISPKIRKKGNKPLLGSAARTVLPILVSIGTIITVRTSVSGIMGGDLGSTEQTISKPRDLGLLQLSVQEAFQDIQPFLGSDESVSEDDDKEMNVDGGIYYGGYGGDYGDGAYGDDAYGDDDDFTEPYNDDVTDLFKEDDDFTEPYKGNEYAESQEEIKKPIIPEEPKKEPKEEPKESNTDESKEVKAVKAVIKNNAYTPKEGTRFEPGTLPISRAESISQCYLEPGLKYSLAKSCAYSPDHGILLTMSGKTGSSTQRYVMSTVWNGTYTGCRVLESKGLKPGTKSVVATREPLDHFLSGFKEMMLRAKLWEKPMDYVYEHIPKEYNSFLDLVKDLDVKQRADLKKSDQPEDVKLKAQMLDTFIADFDGKVFDEHLSLQAMKLRDGNQMRVFDYTLESENLGEELAKLAKIVGAPIPPPIHKRSHSGEPVGEELASDETIQKICRLRASDYCCMNYELPEICKKAGVSKKVECEWVKNPHNTEQLAIKAINIENRVSALSKIKDDASSGPTADTGAKTLLAAAAAKEMKPEMKEVKAVSLWGDIQPKEGGVFEPGSLPVSRNETITRCYLPPGFNYFLAKSCSYSEQYKVLLTMSGKTGSSTQRHVMDKLWNASTYGNCAKLDNEVHPKTVKVVATREPLDHFLSGYKEMMLRAKLWEDENIDGAYNRVPKEYNKFLDVLKDLDLQERKQIKTSSDEEDLKLKAKMLETFVRDFDGKNNFDEHLTLQALKLRSGPKKMRQFDYTLESERLTEDLAKLAEAIGAPIPPPVQKRAHSGEPLGEEYVSNETIQKICKMRASDYCCLNYELPEICRKAPIPKGDKVQCKWVQNPHERNSLAIKPDFV